MYFINVILEATLSALNNLAYRAFITDSNKDMIVLGMPSHVLSTIYKFAAGNTYESARR